MSRFAAVFACCLLLSAPAAAIVGGAPTVAGDAPRHTVMILGSRGTFCTGTAVARDILLTAAHCVTPDAVYKFLDFDAAHKPLLRDVARIARHPQFSQQTFDANRATPDIAVLKLAQPLPADIVPVALGVTRGRVAVGDAFVILGYGVSIRGDGKSSGTLRRAGLIAAGVPGNLQIRLVDPSTKGESPGLGACTGDSGGPVFQESGGPLSLFGVLSWSTGPKAGDGCGGFTGVTPLELYRSWVVGTARKMGSTLGP
jgi:secreted trypsin-like serine protease